MPQIPESLVRYAAYHRDERNIAMHMAGVPLVVLALGLLLAQPAWNLWGQALTPAWVVGLLALVFYVCVAGRLGLVTGLLVLAAFAGARGLQQLSLSPLSWGCTLLAAGLLCQWLGHWYEGRRPAWHENLRGLLAAPLFVTARLGAGLGWFHDINAGLAARVGPSYLRDLVNARL